MHLKSIKFGGTSMGSAKSIQECAKIIKKKINESLVVVTVSAVGGITDKLIEIIRLARKTKPRLVKSKVIEISNIHRQILKNLILDDEKTENLWTQEFEPIINKLEAISYGTSLVGDLTDKTEARICAFGEKLSFSCYWHLKKLALDHKELNQKEL